MKIICISGKAQHGKDTTAGILKRQLELKGNEVLITHYADILKYICKNFFKWDGVKDERGRYLLQHLGTDIIRKKNPDFFTDFLINMLSISEENWDYVIIPDCRFPNEIDALRTTGFPITHIRVRRSDFVSPLSRRQQNHPSETALDNVSPNYYIDNYGTVGDLEERIKNLIDKELKI